MRCPRCMDSDDGPLPVYRKNGFFCSYASRIFGTSLHELVYAHMSCIKVHFIGMYGLLTCAKRRYLASKNGERSVPKPFLFYR